MLETLKDVSFSWSGLNLIMTYKKFQKKLRIILLIGIHAYTHCAFHVLLAHYLTFVSTRNLPFLFSQSQSEAKQRLSLLRQRTSPSRRWPSPDCVQGHWDSNLYPWCSNGCDWPIQEELGHNTWQRTTLRDKDDQQKIRALCVVNKIQTLKLFHSNNLNIFDIFSPDIV